jgi:anti-anti-sigma factor
MTVKKLSEDVLLVTLSTSAKISDNLKAVNNIVAERKDCDVIVDFTGVQIITSANISDLIILHQFLRASGRRLILCNVSFLTKCVFRVTGLGDVFNFTVDKYAALEILQGCSEPEGTSHELRQVN